MPSADDVPATNPTPPSTGRSPNTTASRQDNRGAAISPAILVGHSYGGTVITAAGTDDRVAGLDLDPVLTLDPQAPDWAGRRLVRLIAGNRSPWAR